MKKKQQKKETKKETKEELNVEQELKFIKEENNLIFNNSICYDDELKNFNGE